MPTDLFTKRNSLPGTRLLLAEALGLEQLSQALDGSPLLCPKVFKTTKDQLEMQKIETCPPNKKHWQDLAKGLGHLHESYYEDFGFTEDNYIGLSPQKNTLSKNWGEFFVNYRLRPQINMISDLILKEKLQESLTLKQPELIDFLNAHNPKPSLVHGDLWSGNVLFSNEGPWIFDPAIYYGDAEVDIAMTKMFGGFDLSFYQGYYQIRPQLKNIKDREAIYNTYHYLNHFNLFGPSYVSGITKGFEVIATL